jgi:hypothetical protein
MHTKNKYQHAQCALQNTSFIASSLEKLRL